MRKFHSGNQRLPEVKGSSTNLTNFCCFILFTIGYKEVNHSSVPQWHESMDMDERVEKLESNVGSFMTSQQQILEKINELFGKLNSKDSPLKTIIEREEGEHSNVPPPDQRRSENTMGCRQNNTQQSYIPRLTKLDFPRFNSTEDMTSWVCRVEQLFQQHQTPEEERVALASFHLEGDTQLWFQLIKQEGKIMT